MNSPAVDRWTGAVVYFVTPEEGGPVKIGFAKYVGARLRQLQSFSPLRLKLLGVMPGNDGMERHLHQRFSHLRLWGEWFKRDAALLAFIEKECVPMDEIG